MFFDVFVFRSYLGLTRVPDDVNNLRLSRSRTALQASALVNSLKLVRCIMKILREDKLILFSEIDDQNCQETDALTLAIWNYNIPIVKVDTFGPSFIL